MPVEPKHCIEGQVLWQVPPLLPANTLALTKATVVQVRPHSLALTTPQDGPNPRKFRGQGLVGLHTSPVAAWCAYEAGLAGIIEKKEKELAKLRSLYAAAAATATYHGGTSACPPPPVDEAPEEAAEVG